jgi:hypothetical protein
MRKFIPLLAILCSCNFNHNERLIKLQDTIALVKKKLDYKPLDSAEAYAFINKYYLSRLDTMPTKRKLYLYPLVGKDNKVIFDDFVRRVTAEYNGDTIAGKKVILHPPDPILMDTNSNWNKQRLLNVMIVTDVEEANMFKNGYDHTVSESKAWHKKFGYGYMCISYPVYNNYTKRIRIREWIENANWCGTGRENEFYFKKVPGGWQAD